MKSRDTHPALFAELDQATQLPFASSLAQSDAVDASDVEVFRNATPGNFESNMQNLHLAAYLGYGEIVKLLMENAPLTYVDVQYTQGIGATGITPLYAVIMGSMHGQKLLEEEIQKIAIIQTLLDHNANINFQRFDEQTPLHIAVRKRLPLVTGYLIQNGALINVEDKNGETPLHILMKQDFSENGAKILETLCVHEAYLDHPNIDSKTPIQIAAEENKFDYVLTLLRYGANPKLAAEEDSFIKGNPAAALKMFSQLFNKSNTIEEQNLLQNSLLVSSPDTRQEFFRLLLVDFYKNLQEISQNKNKNLAAGEAMVRQTELSLIIRALSSEQLVAEFSDVFFNLVKSKRLKPEDKQLLLDSALNPDAINLGITALQEKINTEINHTKIEDAYKNIQNAFSRQNPLHQAVMENELDSFAHIIGKDPEILNQQRISDNHSPLSLAIDLKNWPAVIKLLELGANNYLPQIRHQEKAHENILHFAIRDASENIMDRETFDNLLSLLDRRGDLVSFWVELSRDENNPAVLAVRMDNPAVLHQLVVHGAPIEEILYAEVMENRGDMLADTLETSRNYNLDTLRSRASEDKSLLQLAIEKNQFDAINALLQHGAGLSTKDVKGNSPLHYAAMENQPLTVGLFIDRGASVLQENAAGRTFLEEAVFRGIDLKNIIPKIDTKFFFPSLNKKHIDREKPSLLKHAFNYCAQQPKFHAAKPIVYAFTEIARLNPEGFYQEFKTVSANLRKAANNRKLSLEDKLAILKQHKNLCETVYQVAPQLLKRKVKYTNFFFKDNLKDLLLKEQGKLAKKIDILGKKIDKANRQHPKNRVKGIVR